MNTISVRVTGGQKIALMLMGYSASVVRRAAKDRTHSCHDDALRIVRKCERRGVSLVDFCKQVAALPDTAIW